MGRLGELRKLRSVWLLRFGRAQLMRLGITFKVPVLPNHILFPCHDPFSALSRLFRNSFSTLSLPFRNHKKKSDSDPFCRYRKVQKRQPLPPSLNTKKRRQRAHSSRRAYCRRRCGHRAYRQTTRRTHFLLLTSNTNSHTTLNLTSPPYLLTSY